MTDADLKLIRDHMADSTLRWNVLVLQADLSRLLAEVDRLRAAPPVPVNAFHAECPSCGVGVDVVPPPGTTVLC